MTSRSTDSNIKERTRTDQKDANGQPSGTSAWKVVLQEKVLGPYALKLSYDAIRAPIKRPAKSRRPPPFREIRLLNVFPAKRAKVAVIKRWKPRVHEDSMPKASSSSIPRNSIHLSSRRHFPGLC